MSGGYAYVVGDRFLVIEIDPSGPCSIVGSFDLAETAGGEMIVVGDHVYTILGDTTFVEVDVGDPSAPLMTRTYVSDVRLLDIARLGSAVIAVDDDSRLHVIEVNGGKALSASIVVIPDVQIDEIETHGEILATLGYPCGSFDMSDPSSPIILDTFYTYSSRDLQVVGTRLFYYTYTPSDGTMVVGMTIAQDGTLEPAASITINSSPFTIDHLCADDRFLYRINNHRLFIYDVIDLTTVCVIYYADEAVWLPFDIKAHDGILCAVDTDTGFKAWHILDPVAIESDVPFELPGIGTGCGEHWVLNLETREGHHDGLYHSITRQTEIRILDISDVLAPLTIFEHSSSNSCTYYGSEGCDPGSLVCRLNGSRWSLLQYYKEWYDSWRVYDLIGGTYLEEASISGIVTYAHGNIIWSVDGWADTIDKYELSEDNGIQRVYGFSQVSFYAGGLDWLDENHCLVNWPTIEIYDLSNPAGITVSTNWPANVPTDVTFIEVRNSIVYMRSETVLYAIDVTDPMNPTYVDELTLGTWLTSISVSDILPVVIEDGAYLVHLDPEGGFAACSSLLEGHFEEILPVGDLAYCHDGYATLLYDFTDLANPVYIGTGTGGTGGLMLKDGYLIDNAGVYLPHCSEATPTVLQTFVATRDFTRVNVSATLYGDPGGELALWREAEGAGPVELVRLPLPDDGRFAWTDPAPPATAATYRLQLDGAWLGIAAVPAAGVPRMTRLLPNVPNPFNPRTTLRYEMARPGHAELSIYDARGRRVITLLNGDLPAGAGALEWDGRDAKGRDLPSGNYLAEFETDAGTTSRKLLLAR